MTLDWGGMLTIMLAIIAASLVEHTVIAPRMEHSPPTIPFASARNAEDYARQMYPNLITL